MILRQLDIHMRKNEIGLLAESYIKINLKWIKDTNIKGKTIKFIEENIGAIFMTLDYSATPKEQTSEEKKSVQGFTIKHFYASNYIKKVEKQPRDWEITLQVIYLIRDLYLEYIKTHNPIRERQIIQFKKMDKESEYTFLQRYIRG